MGRWSVLQSWQAYVPELPRLRGPGGRPLRVAHLTTVDMSLALLLGPELRADAESGLETYAMSAPGSFRAEIEAFGAQHVPIPALTRSWSPAGDLAAAVERLRAECRTIAESGRVPIQPPSESERRFLSRSLDRPPLEERPGQWQIQQFEGKLPLLARRYRHRPLATPRQMAGAPR